MDTDETAVGTANAPRCWRCDYCGKTVTTADGVVTHHPTRDGRERTHFKIVHAGGCLDVIQMIGRERTPPPRGRESDPREGSEPKLRRLADHCAPNGE